MQANRKITMAITLIAALLMAVLTTGSTLAQEGTEIINGIVVTINADGSIVIDTDGDLETTDDQVTVFLGENSKFPTVAEGDSIYGTGTLGDDGILLCTELKIRERAKDMVKLQDGEGDAYFCDTTLDKKHPVADKIATTHEEVDYETILGYLCAEPPVSLGHIMLALQTAELTSGSFVDFLNGGSENISWGQIWQEYDLIGKPDKGVPPGQIKKQDGEGDPEEKIPPGQKKKQGDGSELDKLFEDLVPKNWFKKGKNN